MFRPKWVLQIEISALLNLTVEYLSFQVGDFTSPHHSERQRCW